MARRQRARPHVHDAFDESVHRDLMRLLAKSGDRASALRVYHGLVELLQRRASLEAQVEELRTRKPLMPAADYAAEFERLMIELARVSRDIRNRKS